MNGLIYLVGLIVVILAVFRSSAFGKAMEMSMEKITPAARTDTVPVGRNDNGWRFVEWSPIVLGALAATALSSVLVGFGVTIGLGIRRLRRAWRDASAALAILSGLYLIFQATISFGVGGYLAGRVRASADAKATVVEETERADGVHGLGVWALAVVMGAILATLIGVATVSQTSPCGALHKQVRPSRC